MWSAPAERIWMGLRLGSVAIFCTAAGRTPSGRTTYSTWSALCGRSSPPAQTSASIPGGRGPNLSGESGSHTRVKVMPPCLVASRDSQAEVGAAVLRDEVGVLGVLLDPRVDVGAERQHAKTALARVVEAEPRQVRGQVRAFEGRLHLGVDEADHRVVIAQQVVDEPGEFGADVQLIPGRGRVIGHNGRVGSG